MKFADKDDRRALYEAFLSLETPEEFHRFISDLCTPGEIADFSERWSIVRLLDQGDLGYREIAAVTKGSTTTVGRVARCLFQNGEQGYRLVLDRLKGRVAK